MYANMDCLSVANASEISSHRICARTVVAADVAGAENGNVTECYVVGESDADLVIAVTISSFDPWPAGERKIDIERARISMNLARHRSCHRNNCPSTIEFR